MSSGPERKLFGTDGIRGTANVHPMTPEVALALGRAIAHVFREAEGERKQILIGKDTRLSGYMFEDALAAGICSMGVNVIQVGPVPTPALAFLTGLDFHFQWAVVDPQGQYVGAFALSDGLRIKLAP